MYLKNGYYFYVNKRICEFLSIYSCNYKIFLFMYKPSIEIKNDYSIQDFVEQITEEQVIQARKENTGLYKLISI